METITIAEFIKLTRVSGSIIFIGSLKLPENFLYRATKTKLIHALKEAHAEELNVIRAGSSVAVYI